MTAPWAAWTFDRMTWSWLVWIAAFVVLETIAVYTDSRETLTWHLRPIFTEHPLMWFFTLGLWLWLGVHFLAPRMEGRMLGWFVR